METTTPTPTTIRTVALRHGTGCNVTTVTFTVTEAPLRVARMDTTVSTVVMLAAPMPIANATVVFVEEVTIAPAPVDTSATLQRIDTEARLFATVLQVIFVRAAGRVC